MASLKLTLYKLKHQYLDFLKVLICILLFEGMVLFIQKKDFLKFFESTRMTFFLLLFATSLLILVQNSIYISKEYKILQRDFFSAINRIPFGVSSLALAIFYAIVESTVFLYGYRYFTHLFDKTLEKKGFFLNSFDNELLITVILVFICSHFVALFISSLVGGSEITSVILSVVVGICQFSLAGTILQLPKEIKPVTKMIYLSYGHKLFGATNRLADLPSAMHKFQIPIEKSQLKQFQLSKSDILSDWKILFGHCLVYAILFLIVLKYRKESK